MGPLVGVRGGDAWLSHGHHGTTRVPTPLHTSPRPYAIQVTPKRIPPKYPPLRSPWGMQCVGEAASPAKAIQASPPHASPPLREPFQGSYSLLFHNAFKRTACRRTVWSAALSSIGATPFFCEWFTVVPRVSSTGWLAVCSAFFCACANLS